MKVSINFKEPNFDKLTTNQLKQVADYWQRQYLLRHADRDPFNRIKCPITGKFYSEDKIHVCHIVDRAKITTRYDLENVFLGSAYSNTFEAKRMKEGYKSLHHARIELKFGKDYVDKLHERAEEIKLMSKEDYILLITKYMNE